MKTKSTLLIFLALFTSVLMLCANYNSQDKVQKMNTFIDNLMGKMTLDEKLGQLNLPSSGDITTGAANSSNIAAKIKEGKVGGLFNIKTIEKIRDVQKIAVEQSRLKIPLIFGMDVIHGYQTVFPIPLGMSCSGPKSTDQLLLFGFISIATAFMPLDRLMFAVGFSPK